ncbi:hypothetical protein RAA17_00050 [Komagataeibacter rhaeticus]|nr:hypothetical protein [Komagataeibacter rhaeticus]
MRMGTRKGRARWLLVRPVPAGFRECGATAQPFDLGWEGKPWFWRKRACLPSPLPHPLCRPCA